MFRLNFDGGLVEEESCEKNILLRDRSYSTLDAHVHTHALTTGLFVLTDTSSGFDSATSDV